MNEGPARSSSARAWRIAAGVLAALVILAGIAIGALRFAISRVPENAGRVQAWVEQQTRLRIEYRGIDARLRWFGPEVVLHDVRVLDRDGTQALFATREGSVGLDVWNFFRTGQLVAGRIRFVGPDITVVRLADGRIRLLGQRERPADEPPFDLDRLPAGRVVIEDAKVTYRDLKTGRGPWTVDGLQLTLRRDHEYVSTEGYARLPAALGGKVRFEGRLRGSLDTFAQLQARIELRADTVRLAGWGDFLPSFAARPRSGEGPVTALVSVRDGALRQARFDLNLSNVALDLPARTVPTITTVEVSAPHHLAGDSGMHLPLLDIATVERPAKPLPRTVRYAVLAGHFRLRQEQGLWQFRMHDLRTAANASRLTDGARVAGSLRGDPVTTFDFGLDASHVRFAEVWPLVLAFAPPSFDRWAGLDPRGEVRSAHLELHRTRAGAPPAFIVSAEVVDLGVSPTARWPGLKGITASLSGTDERGRIGLRTGAAALTWPRLFRAPIVVQKASADLDWRHDGSTWVLGTQSVDLQNAAARASGSFELSLPRGDESPVLAIDARVEGSDASLVGQFLPAGRLKPRTLAWLDRAFVHGQVRNGRFVYRGPVRQFPFRHDEGQFDASADIVGATLDYFPGFAPLTDAVGRVEFHNAGMRADLKEGQVAGLRVTKGDYVVEDFKTPLMLIHAEGTGDLAKALAYLQGSPLGPRLGRFVMGLGGNGPTDFKFALTLPPDDADGAPQPVDYRVRADLKSVDVTLPAVRAPAQKVSGVFELHNLEARAESLSGTILGGPFEVSIAPGAPGGDVDAAIEFHGRGRASGAPLPAFIGLPAAIRMNGTADWELKGRVERHGTASDWPLHIDVSSPLTGLEIVAPQPFAKASTEARATHVRLDVPSNGVNDVAVETGSARARLRFTETTDGKWRLERGLARFDAQPASLPSRPGLLVAGDWPQFDLGEWLALRSGDDSGPKLSDWLGPVDVHLDRARVAGFELHDVLAQLRFAGSTWQIGLYGPMAEGEVTIPDDLSTGQPIVLQMQRLSLQSAAPAAAPGGSTAESTDPRTLPAITLRADDFTWEARHFGAAQAVIAKTPAGLRFDTLTAVAPSFTVNAQGSWLREGDTSRTRLAFELDSTDLVATSNALGYREAVAAKHTSMKASVDWEGGPSADAIARLEGKLHIALDDGQLLDVKPGAGRILGLMSVVELPRRLALDFRDVTEKGLAFDKVRGDFDLRKGNAYTQNLLLKGAAVDIGVAGRTGLATEDYDQTIVVSGNPSGPLTVAGALAGGPVGAAGALVISQLFKGQLQGLTRAYYHVSGPWSNPVVERISAPPGEAADGGEAPGEKH